MILKNFLFLLTRGFYHFVVAVFQSLLKGVFSLIEDLSVNSESIYYFVFRLYAGAFVTFYNFRFFITYSLFRFGIWVFSICFSFQFQILHQYFVSSTFSSIELKNLNAALVWSWLCDFSLWLIQIYRHTSTWWIHVLIQPMLSFLRIGLRRSISEYTIQSLGGDKPFSSRVMWAEGGFNRL